MIKISDQTIELLKNFAQINQGILINPGKEIQTLAKSTAIYARADVDEEFPVECGIYDLPALLSIISLYQKQGENPNLNFKETELVISNNESQTQVRYAAPTTITAPPKGKRVEFGDPDLTINLSKEKFQSIMNFGDVLKSTHIVIKKSNDSVVIQCCDLTNDSANVYKEHLKDVKTDLEEFCLVFKKENLLMLMDGYKIEVSKSKPTRAKFTNASKKVEYFVTLEKTGTRL